MPDDPKANWLKDLLFPLVLALVGAFLGVLGDEYKAHLSTPRLRHHESVGEQAQKEKYFRQKITTTFRSDGRRPIPNLVVEAYAATHDVRIVEEIIDREPPDQLPDAHQFENGDPVVTRGLRVANLHIKQLINWSIVAESPAESPAMVKFTFSGIDDIENESHLDWTERLPLLDIVLGLLIYSIVSTMLAVYFRFKKRSDNDLQV